MRDSLFFLLQKWLAAQLFQQTYELCPLPGDASFRRYFRVQGADKPYLAVISPPATENNAAFVDIAHTFAAMNLHVPTVFATDLTQGFLLLADLGNALFFREVTKDNADYWYPFALQTLRNIQTCPLSLPHFDSHWMHKELAYFQEWVLEKHLQCVLSRAQKRLLQNTFTLLLQSATAQPQCCIHRDYHSRNLMLLPSKQLGILDFQDAMIGPITYDIVSLIRDCYRVWPKEQVIQWAADFYDQHLRQQIPSKNQYFYWLDLMGMQRHLKASFIFARKFHRDQMNNYLSDLRRALNYVAEISQSHTPFYEFHQWLINDIIPRLPEHTPPLEIFA